MPAPYFPVKTDSACAIDLLAKGGQAKVSGNNVLAAGKRGCSSFGLIGTAGAGA